MAFSVDYTGAPRRRLFYLVKRHSDGSYWNRDTRCWAHETTYNRLPEQAPGHYSVWLTATTRGDSYEVAVLSQGGGSLINNYTCDAQGNRIEPAGKGQTVNATLVQGVLYVDGKPEKPAVVLEALSSTGTGTRYTAIKWGPSGITSCDCPGWTMSGKNKGKTLTERSCKHTKRVATMTASIHLSNQILPPSTEPTPGTQRAGRSIELD
jgi:hypothetical protein